MSSIGGCQELDFLPEILYPWSAATIELIGHLQHQNTREKKMWRGKNLSKQMRQVIALIPKEVKKYNITWLKVPNFYVSRTEKTL